MEKISDALVCQSIIGSKNSATKPNPFEKVRGELVPSKKGCVVELQQSSEVAVANTLDNDKEICNLVSMLSFFKLPRPRVEI